MGYILDRKSMDAIIHTWGKDYDLYAPTLFKGEGRFADTDMVRYGIIHSLTDIVIDKKSDYSFKEALLPISQTLFFFTEDVVKEADNTGKPPLLFLRACDFHALARLDDIYLANGFEDFYYQRLRKHARFVLLSCDSPFENCNCAALGTNCTENYDCSLEIKGETVYTNNKHVAWEKLFKEYADKECEVIPSYPNITDKEFTLPQSIPEDIKSSPIWTEYDSRCIGCGRCTFVCPTCTCFTMQDIFYQDNEKTGERRRVWASCMVDGFTDMAGNISFRKGQGERMRFRILHKIFNHKNRTGRHMCIGCGRCEDICPEYISFKNCVNKIVDSNERGES